MNPYAALDATAQAALVRDGSGLAASSWSRPRSTPPRPSTPRSTRSSIRATSGPSTRRPPSTGSAPFAGVPLVVKDLDGTLAGEPYHAGTRHLRDAGYIADVTSWLFERLQAAGFVIIGKTNTPEFGLVPTTESEAYGPARNPWNTGPLHRRLVRRSAAAVAAGIVPVGHAGDGGGSIRIPASECGLVGLKPTRGRCRWAPTRPSRGVASSPASPSHGRSATPQRCSTSCAVPAPATLRGTDPAPAVRRGGRRRPRRLRIGVSVGGRRCAVADPEFAAAVRPRRPTCSRRSVTTYRGGAAPARRRVFFAEMSGYFLTAFPVWVAQSVDDLGVAHRHACDGRLGGGRRLGARRDGSAVGAVAFANATEGMRRLSRGVQAWWAGRLTPVRPADHRDHPRTATDARPVRRRHPTTRWPASSGPRPSWPTPSVQHHRPAGDVAADRDVGVRACRSACSWSAPSVARTS